MRNPKDINILVGCEESQAVTIELRKKGLNAFSCDFKKCSGGHPEWHLNFDVLVALNGGVFITESGDSIEIKKWHGAILHPDCTYITVSGLHWNKKIPGRAQKTEDALLFVTRLWNICKSKGIENVAIEIPVGCISTRIILDSRGYLIVIPAITKKGFKPTQSIQPYNFGENASKKTCLWLNGFPKLIAASYIEPRIINGKKRWANQTDDGQNKLIIDGTWIGFNDERTKTYRSKTYNGIASAIADQWGNYLLNTNI